MAEALMPLTGQAHVQAAVLAGERLAWAEVSRDGRRVDWILYGATGETEAYGSDSIAGRRLDTDRQAALDAAVRRLIGRYPVPVAAATKPPRLRDRRKRHSKKGAATWVPPGSNGPKLFGIP